MLSLLQPSASTQTAYHPANENIATVPSGSPVLFGDELQVGLDAHTSNNKSFYQVRALGRQVDFRNGCINVLTVETSEQDGMLH